MFSRDLEEAIRELTLDARSIATSPERHYADVLRTQQTSIDYATLCEMRERVRERLPGILSSTKMPSGTSGTVHVSTDRRIVVVLKDHTRGLCERAAKAAAEMIVNVDKTGASGFALWWGMIVLLAREAPLERLREATLEMLRPRLPPHIGETLDVCLPWVTWTHAPREESQPSRYLHPGYTEADHRLMSDTLLDIQRSSVAFFHSRVSRAVACVVRCADQKEAEWVAHVSGAAVTAVFSDHNHMWYARCGSGSIISCTWVPGVLDPFLKSFLREVEADRLFHSLPSIRLLIPFAPHSYESAKQVGLIGPGDLGRPDTVMAESTHLLFADSAHHFMAFPTERDDQIREKTGRVLGPDVARIVTEYGNPNAYRE